MKQALLIFFSLYCIALSAMPCRDACETHTHEVSVTASDVDNHHQEDSDKCSPFCFCSCCSVSVLTTYYLPLSLVEVSMAALSLPDYQSILLEQSYSIWQPPKLG